MKNFSPISSVTNIPMKTYHIIPVFLVLFASSTVFAQKPGDTAPPAVRVETVAYLTAGQPKPYVGIVAAKEEVNLVARISGTLTKVAFREGAIVEKGDLLFEIEDTVYKINVRVAESTIKQIEAELALARRDYERARTLRASNTISESELDEKLRNVDLQGAKLEEAAARLDGAKNDLSYTKIHAPLSGRIGAKLFSEGNYITPNSGILASIVQVDPITVKFAMSEADFINFSQGTDIRDAGIEIVRPNGQPYAGTFKVDFLDNKVDRRTGTRTIHLLCEQKVEELTPGGYAKVNIAERFGNPRPAVNVAALMTDGDRHFVYVVDEVNKVERRSVKVGRQVFDKQIVTAGLNTGEQVVVGGLNKIRPGIEVKPMLPEGTQGIKVAQR